MAFKERKRWKFLGLPFTFTVYTIEEEKITVNKGFLNTTEDSLYMYKVLDVKLERTLGERMFGLGTIICYNGDVTDKILKIEHIKNSKEIMNFIFNNSEEMRRRRRTLNTQSLTAGFDSLDSYDLDGDGVQDQE